MIHTRYSRRHRRKIKPNTRQRIRVMHAYVAKGSAPSAAVYTHPIFHLFGRKLW